MGSPLDWLRDQVNGWEQSALGIFRLRSGQEQWPVQAAGPEDLKEQLLQRGHLLPLPTEPAALANLIEIELREHLVTAAAGTPGVEIRLGTERSYPDLELSGPAFGDRCYAVDIKCARRAKSGTSLQNRIALYTGNTYFLWPTLNFSGILRPFDDYAEHFAVVAIYNFLKSRPERISDLQMIVHESWRIASTKRASATREYIGSVQSIGQLTAGEGEFRTVEAFETYWRASSRNWKKSPEAEKLLRRAIDK
ncbi:type II restriction endonuclease [Candidatus Poriferisocius sp.]|uniref:type II restriction endonuclease n=1 Tax=Candidatus Poriferisocius sp. TaxID=3101276 RepID=UPI003B01FA4E